ncbi:MAG: zinc-dependent peptidase [Candidatus Eisenbacteria bacterium]|uniref:Zinc-dependent peptidase n=1 Tax=Eiseniibacteriota bacterium TaxID=2212470 RepID=A0A956NJP2_UNCEI|nr:zinc-dependent peptidase [Candidatus Eisenbacteria bacterium]MCB9466170.1 zinc-dependent peptidase [Candidatus Eisenbacteria bacterium]
MPQNVFLVLFAIGAGIVLLAALRATRQRSSRRLRAQRLTEHEREIVARNVAMYSRMPKPLQTRLEGLIQEFRATKSFEGQGGLVLTEEIELTIAAAACVLLLGRPNDPVYPALSSVIVYPTAFRGRGHRDQGDDGDTVRLGESWHTGAVILSWDDTLVGTTTPNDAHNVVFHEFAHQLDQADGASDGTPNLGHRRSRYVEWAKVLGGDFLEMRRTLAEGRQTWLNAYGATNEAEFFAVATEFFFERPNAMRQRDPELFAELQSFYGIDPSVFALDPHHPEAAR